MNSTESSPATQVRVAATFGNNFHRFNRINYLTSTFVLWLS